MPEVTGINAFPEGLSNDAYACDTLKKQKRFLRKESASASAYQRRVRRSMLLPSTAQKQETPRYSKAVTSHNSKVMRETAMTSRL